MAGWAAAFASGGAAAVLPAVEADLASPSPDPMAAGIWLRLEAALGRDPAASAARLPPVARRRLGEALHFDPAADARLLAASLAAAPPAAVAATGNAALLAELGDAAAVLGRWDLALDYRLALRAARPDAWSGVAVLLDHLAAHPSPEQRRRIATLASPAVPFDLAAEAGGALLPGDRLAWVRRWLIDHPDDAGAWRDAGSQLMALERWAEAADAFTHAAALNPFVAAGTLRATALLHLGRMDAARAAIASAAARLAPAGDARNRLELGHVARALAAAGELGRADGTLAAALALWPADPVLLLEDGRVQRALGQPVRAITPLRQAVDEGGHAVREAMTELVEAWDAAGKPVRAFQAYKALRRKGHRPDPALAVAAMRAAMAYGDFAAADAVGDKAEDAAPEAPDVLAARAEALAGLGATGRAAEKMARALRLAPPDSGRLSHLEIWSDGGDLPDLRRDMPWSAAVWHAAPPAEPEAELAAAPHLAWPYLDLAARAADPAAARAALDRGLAAIPQSLPGQRAVLLGQRASLAADDRALADLAEAERLGLPEGEVARRRAAIFAARGRWAEAAAAAWAWAVARPDDGAAMAALFGPEIVAQLGWPSVFTRLHGWVQRNPDDRARALEALRWQAGPGGCPVQAVAAAEALAVGDPTDPRVAEADRLRARVMARLSRLGTVRRLDTATNRLDIERTDGTRIRAEFHPRSGRLIRYADGPAWMQAEWQADGTRLHSLADAAGDLLTLDWQGGRLAGLRLTGGAPLHALLGPGGAPQRIESDLPPAAAKAAYDAAAAVVEAWTADDLAALPELPRQDPALDRLTAAEQKDGDRARLATAIYLIDHIGDRRAYADEARARLGIILDRAMAQHPQTGSPGMEAARQWRRLALAAWPDGLNADAWRRWNAICAWAGDPALDRDGPVPAQQ